MRKLIIDTDPGIDDALALIACFRHVEDVEILGITTVAGNKGIRFTTDNATKLIKYFAYPCKVYKGAQRPLVPSICIPDNGGTESAAGDVHGGTGLGDADLPSAAELISDQSAVDFILEQVRSNPGEIDILALGPLTNIALAIRQDKNTMQKLRSIYSMGGSLYGGNITPVAEFNYWFDPDAADFVYKSLGETLPIYMIGLDLTHQLILSHDDMFLLREEGAEIGAIIYQMLAHYAKNYWHDQRILGVVIHDLTAALCYLYPELVADEKLGLLECIAGDGVDRGQCLCKFTDEENQEYNSHIIRSVNKAIYKDMLFLNLIGKKYSDIIY